MEEAVVREVKEEILVDFKPFFYRIFKGVNKERGVKWLSSYFIGYIRSDEIPDNYDKNELAELKFFSKEEWVDLEIALDHKRVLKAFFKDYSLGLIVSVRDKSNKN